MSLSNAVIGGGQKDRRGLTKLEVGEGKIGRSNFFGTFFQVTDHRVELLLCLDRGHVLPHATVDFPAAPSVLSLAAAELSGCCGRAVV